MNTASLLKRAPILIMVVCLSYACYTIHAILPDAGSGPNELAKGLDVMVEDALHIARRAVSLRFGFGGGCCARRLGPRCRLGLVIVPRSERLPGQQAPPTRPRKRPSPPLVC